MKMFAVHIILNEEGRKVYFESLQGHIESMEELSELLNQYGIKKHHIKVVEIVHTDEWNGWKY